LRSTVHGGVDEEVEQDVGDRDKAVDSFSSANRWTN